MLSEEVTTSARPWTAGIDRLLGFAVSPTSQIPRDAFRDNLLTTAAALLDVEQAVLLELDERTFEFVATAGKDVAPGPLAALRVRPSQGPLARALQSASTIVITDEEALADMPWLKRPALAIPLRVESRTTALLLLGAPAHAEVPSRRQALAEILQKTASLMVTNHFFFEKARGGREAVIATLVRALDAKGAVSHPPPKIERDWIRALGREIHLPSALLDTAEGGMRLRDIGMLGIDETLLKKPDRFTEADQAAIKQHPRLGHTILQDAPELRAVAAIVLTHQEWFNGKGYPEGLAGEEIPLVSRLVSIVDAWSAMASERPYRKALAPNAAMAELRRLSGTQFDPRLVEAFLHVLENRENPGAAQAPA